MWLPVWLRSSVESKHKPSAPLCLLCAALPAAGYTFWKISEPYGFGTTALILPHCPTVREELLCPFFLPIMLLCHSTEVCAADGTSSTLSILKPACFMFRLPAATRSVCTEGNLAGKEAET